MATKGRESQDHGVRGEVRQDRYVAGQDLTRWKSPVGQLMAATAQRITTFLGPYAALVITLVIGLLISIALVVTFGEVYESVTEADGVAGLDHPVLDAAKSFRSPALDAATTAYTNVGGTVGMPLIAVGIMIFLATKRKSWTPVILMLAAGLGSLLLTVAGKPLFGRTRPDLSDAIPPFEHSPSFPSGHSLNSIVIAGIVAYLVILRLKSKRARILTIVIASVFSLTMGLSRVYLGHHWLTDVLAAWALGIAWLSLVIMAHRLYLTVRTRHHQEAAS
ncbi:phosphatase PAP2 family protein [Paenarthrobacter ureafaciens]|uniref:phosphatase PAP2 family protein n=1 Tax=Paenarthrobacter ureafaciens TaxID=37931 RepID=UPI00140A140D|nr:phosphatase PAP2 family protein [Paenarthrobacter ureafaciens]MCX8456344.1 phosphatase PAP2 family protein [Paenarthrobacter ureafaciens]MCY0973827.1 phosphatase PAP2 family protein [Paenarthrobacter ureafaciens]